MKQILQKEAELLEMQAQFEAALRLLRLVVIERCKDSSAWHQIGRLYQRMGMNEKARKAYEITLGLNPMSSVTFNNLGILALEELDSIRARGYVEEGLKTKPLLQDRLRLLNTMFQVVFFERDHRNAKDIAEEMLMLGVTPRGLNNLALALLWMGRPVEAELVQRRCLEKAVLDYRELVRKGWIWAVRGLRKGERNTEQFLIAMNYAQIVLSIDNTKWEYQQMLMAGLGVNGEGNGYRNKDEIWDGKPIKEIDIWDDMGFGDSLQNICMVIEAAKRASVVTLWLRRSLIRFSKKRIEWPPNVIIRELVDNYLDSRKAIPGIGLWYLPIVMGCWKDEKPRAVVCGGSGKQCVQRKVGLVWSAGKHKSPQPERNARVRDVSEKLLVRYVRKWSEDLECRFKSLQIGENGDYMNKAVEEGLIEDMGDVQDWEETASIVEQLAAVVTVDTAMAHLCGQLRKPCVLLLNAPCDWRWGQSGDTTTLYETTKVARCSGFDAWESALERAGWMLHEIMGRAI